MAREPHFTHNDLDDFRGVGLVVLPILVSDEPDGADDATGRSGAA